MSMTEFMLDGAGTNAMHSFEREFDVKVISAAAPWSEFKQQFAKDVGGEIWLDPLRRPDLVVVVARNTPPCKFKNNAEAINALIAASPRISIRKSGPDAFGSSPNVNGWSQIVISNKHFTDVTIAARRLGIKLYDPICGDTYGTVRKINVEQQKEDLVNLQNRLGARFDEYVFKAPQHEAIEKGYYTADGCPLKCPCCDCDDIAEKIEDYIDVGVGAGPVSERSYSCSSCGSVVGYWAYGYFDGSYMNMVTEKKSPKP